MDEPFGALDSQTRLMMQELVLQLWVEYQPTIIFITHDVRSHICVGSHLAYVAPARKVKTAVDVGEPKPRGDEFLRSSKFVDLQADLLKSLRQEVH